jgi:hypothetical protein
VQPGGTVWSGTQVSALLENRGRWRGRETQLSVVLCCVVLCCVLLCSVLFYSILLARLTPTRQATLLGSSTHTLHFSSFTLSPHLTSPSPPSPPRLASTHLPPLTTFRRLAPASRVLPGLPSAGRTLDGEWSSHAARSAPPSLVNLIRTGSTGDRPHSAR